MVNVCADFCGSTVLLAQNIPEEEAYEFIKHKYVMFHADELEDGDEDIIIYPSEMFISEEEIPFTETEFTNPYDYDDTDELPF